ncbi:protein ANTI-SILENCING 1 [Raphanus sativus]|uniref:Protein ANTI-SILENCING 1 n=1 Tax=Raphanus sativus TaxID=3726 RepID=A0A6J0K2Y7_RAPSA|nr:protein ANTI-SILENCING 1 [Raphanus sativus]XP_018442285.1 protein ANTI-SILENCING 1 [Raphanus sativus]
MEEAAASVDEGLEFKWGKQKGVGGKKKDVRFYESFTFDGDEYCLHDCVLVTDPNEPDSDELFVGKIIKIWEHTNKRAKHPRQVKLLWFFKPSEMPPGVVEAVPDVLANELFLASGEGPGLASVNPLEAICGKCSVLCISKDERNPQPADDEEIKASDFVFRRAFDVGSCEVLDTIDDKIAGVDVKCIFNRAGSKKEVAPVQKIQADVNGSPDSLKPNGLSVSGSVRNTEDNSTESSDCRESNSNKDSSVQQNTSEHVSCEASGSGGDHDDGKAQENEVRKQFIKQKSMPPEDRCSNSCEASGSKKPLIKQKSMPAGERDSRESNGLDDRPRKKQKLDGSVTVSNGRSTDISQRDASTEGKRDTDVFKRPREKVTGGEDAAEESRFVKKKPYLGVSVSEGKDAKTGTEKGLSKRPSFDGKLIKRAEDKMVETDYKRNCQVTEVSRKPDAVNSKWFRPLPWEESMREAEKEEKLVLLQNLDPTYTSEEVQDIVFSALNELCTARMIERTSLAFSHIGEALVIFNSRQAAVRAITRLDEGCLLLSNGRPLIGAFAKVNPPGKPSSPFCGHIKLQKSQTRRETRDSVSTSRGSQPNTLEFEMAMEWRLHRARSDHALETVSKRQLDERKSQRINFKPKLP